MDYEHKRLSANIKTGDFAEGEYDRQLELDFENLCIYDNLIKMDIKEYYGRIYTHDLGIDFNDEKIIKIFSKLQYQIELVLNYDLKINYYNEYILSKCISNNSSGVL